MQNLFDVLSGDTQSWHSEIIGSVNANRVNARVMVAVEAPFHSHEVSDELRHRARVSGRAELLTVIAESS
jgi:hypothetical protein